MVSTLPLLKQLVLIIVLTPAAENELCKARVRWLRLSSLHGAPAGHTSRVPGCASSSGIHSICSRAATNSGSRELWSMACAFKVGSGERDDVSRVVLEISVLGSLVADTHYLHMFTYRLRSVTFQTRTPFFNSSFPFH